MATMTTTALAARTRIAVPVSARTAPEDVRTLPTVVGLTAVAGLGVAALVARSALPTTWVATAASAIASWAASAASALTWATALCLTVMISLQYLAAAVSARAAAGVDLPYGELVAVQVAGTAANSVTPVGLGGATVNGRYFARRGGLAPAQTGAALSVLAVLGGTSDVLAFALLVAFGSVFGIAGASAEVPLLLHRVLGWVPTSGTTWAWIAAGVTVGAAIAALVTRRREAVLVRRLASGARAYRHTVTGMLRSPGRLTVLMGASAATTLLMAAGFAAIATLGPAALPLHSFGALMIGYMVASAAGNAVPTPGGIGAADAAFAGVLLAAHVPVAAAVGTVLAYRLITFWAPVAVGAGLVRPLRRRGAL